VKRKSVLKSIAQLLFSQRQLVIRLFFWLVMLGLFQALIILLVGPFLKVILTAGSQATNLSSLLPSAVSPIFGRWRDVAIPSEHLALVIPIALALVGLLKALTSYGYQLTQEAIGLAAAKDMRDQVFEAIVSRPWSEIASRQAGQWMSMIMNDVYFLHSRLTDLLTAFVKDGFLILSCIPLMFWIHWPSALILLGISPLIVFGAGRAGKKIAFVAEMFQRELAKMAGTVLNLRSRFDFAVSQRGQSREKQRFEIMNRDYFNFISKSLPLRASLAPLMEFIGFSIFAGFVFLIGHKSIGTDFSGDDVLRFFAALGLLLRPLRQLGEQMMRFHETSGALARTMELMEASTPIVKKEAAIKLPEKIIFERVGIKYGEQQGFSADLLSLIAGHSLAIVGPSGAGKSSYIRLLAGLLSPNEWEANVDWREFANQVAFVSQEPFLFDGSIRDNLTYGLELVPSDSQLKDALDHVHMWTDVDNMVGKLDALIRTMPTNLSGGQMQRLVIARALLRDNMILVLDEFSSALDPKIEHELTKTLVGLARKKGLFLVVVTHRFESISHYDQVMLVEGGYPVFCIKPSELDKHHEWQSFMRHSQVGMDG